MRKTLTRAGFIVAATAAFLGSGGHGGRAATARTDAAKGQSSGPAVPLAPLPGGNVAQAFAFDPHQPDVLYVASAHALGGVYVFKTTDNGQHWTSTEPQGAGWMSDVLSLTADPRHSGTLYAGTDTAVYKTTNGGHSWQPFKQGLFPAPHQTCPGPPDRSPWCWKYPYYGTPGKTSWNRGNGWVLDVAVDPVHSNVVYSAAGAVRKSTDGGHTWKSVLKPQLKWMSVTRYGHTWKNVLKPPKWMIVTRIAIAPTRPESIYAITQNRRSRAIYKSTNAGKTWHRTGSADTLAVDPGNPIKLYAVVGGNVLVTTNGGASWHPRTSGLPAHEVTSLTSSPGRSGTVYASSAVGLNHADTGGVYQPAGAIYETTDSGKTWTAVFSSIGVGSIAVDPGRPSTIYATGWAPSDQTYADKMHLLRSTDAGHTWAISP
jgi:photosystem II stability/assembly factor-like uncharacterized protein